MPNNALATVRQLQISVRGEESVEFDFDRPRNQPPSGERWRGSAQTALSSSPWAEIVLLSLKDWTVQETLRSHRSLSLGLIKKGFTPLIRMESSHRIIVSGVTFT
jgi:hypothetical protein